MGCVHASYHRYGDLTHHFGVTEKSALALFQASGFQRQEVEIGPDWNAATVPGYLRELYLRILHRLVFLSEDSDQEPSYPRNTAMKPEAILHGLFRFVNR